MQEQYILNTIQSIQQKLSKQKAISSRYSLIRLFLIACIGITLYEGYNKASWFYLLMVTALFLFFWFVHIHMHLKKDIEIKEAMLECYQDILARKQEEWKQFHDNGSEFLVEEATQAYDLDIFGPASLFQYVSVAKTISGREQLANLLRVKKESHESMLLRQQAVGELIEQQDFNIKMSALLKLFERHSRKKKKQSIEDVYAYMENDTAMYPAFVSVLSLLLSASTIVLIILASLGILPAGYPLITAVLSVAIAMLSVIKNSEVFSSIQALDHMMADYERLFTEFGNTTFQSDVLKRCHEDVKDASSAIHRLHTILTAVQMRNDGIMFIVMNGLFLLDFQCVSALEHWKKHYGKKMQIWLDTLGELEALLSLSQLSYAKKACSFPKTFKESTPHIHMSQVYHPLICEKQAIHNDFEANASSYIITGSNMSGKTTFLRTIGLNMVLFHAGAMVCADSFSANSMNIYTSMRIKDDVSEGISTFYAEILRIKGMIEESADKEPMLLLIDEIFKGTNSADRIICAKEVLRQLHLPWIISLVSTHDFELCTLTFDNKETAINYHFSEYYDGDEIHFDYLLKEGRCTTTNAKELLRMAGIKGEFSE